jgi:hypothetical protein
MFDNKARKSIVVQSGLRQYDVPLDEGSCVPSPHRLEQLLHAARSASAV